MASGRDTYNQVGRGNWEPFLWLSAQERPRVTTLEQRVALLEAEQDVRDLLTRYAYAWDSRDIAGCVGLFAEDAVLITTRGTYEGRDAIRDNYEGMANGRGRGQGEGSVHRPVNVLVRVEGDLQQAWLTAYWHVAAQVRSLFGNYFMRLVNTAEGWRIADCRIAWDFYAKHELPTEPYPVIDNAKGQPTSPATAFDWTGRGGPERFRLGS